MIVAIPSKGRPTKVKSQDLLTGAVVYVPRNEEASYRRAGVQHVVAVPDGVRGITATRNWILDHTPDRWVVFVDDDLKNAGWLDVLDVRMGRETLTEPQWIGEFARCFEVMEGAGLRIWGAATMSAPRAWYPYKPFMFHTYITASCMGVLNDGRTRFDETFKVKEDYELCLRCIKEDGGVLGVRYIFWENDHWTQPGGCKDYRTQPMELDAIRRLIRMYPGMIRQVTRGKSQYSVHLQF